MADTRTAGFYWFGAAFAQISEEYPARPLMSNYFIKILEYPRNLQDLLLTNSSRAKSMRTKIVEKRVTSRIPASGGDFILHLYREITGGQEHLAFVLGDPAGDPPALVRIHSECFTGDVLGSQRCCPQSQRWLRR